MRKLSDGALMSAAVLALLGSMAVPALAKVSATEAAKLGAELTCFGGIVAGTESGVAKFTGKWLGVPDNVKYDPNSFIYPDPYASEKPVAVVTSKNMAEHKQFLSAGQQALFNKYPDSYQLKIYPSHRDFRLQDWRCERSKENALNAVIKDAGMGVVGLRGAPPFPIASNGEQMFWNITLPARVYEEEGIYDNNVIYANGSRNAGRVHYRIYSPNNDKTLPKAIDEVAKANVTVLLPDREKGNIFVAVDYDNFKTRPRAAWQYNTGTRRVRQMPTFGFDQPAPAAGGTATVDDDRLFNGSPERYNWKLVGRKELYIPYNSYRTDQPGVKYKDLYPQNHHNPDYWRYELHRVYVLEATLKPGYRHIYAKRVFYIDEDSMNIVHAENYDARGQLWRIGILSSQYLFDAKVYEVRASLFYDLNAGAYLIDRAINEQKDRPRYNRSKLSPNLFTPAGLRSQGR